MSSQHISLTMDAPIFQMTEDDSILLRSWSTIAEKYDQITAAIKIVMLKYAPTQLIFDAMAAEIKLRILEGLGEDAMMIMEQSQLSKGHRTKTPAEIELASARSRVVRRVLYLYKTLRNEIFTNDDSLPIVTKIPLPIQPPLPPSSPVDSIPSPTILGDSQLTFENAPTVAHDPIDGEITEADINRFANLRLEPNQSNGGGERYDRALHLLDRLLPRIIGVCGVFNELDTASTAYLLSKGRPSIHVTFPNIQDVVFDFIVFIPPPHLQLSALDHCIQKKIPAFLYLPMHLLGTYPINKSNSRLNLYIAGDHAWYSCNFNIDLFGKGGSFELAKLN